MNRVIAVFNPTNDGLYAVKLESGKYISARYIVSLQKWLLPITEKVIKWAYLDK